MPYKNKSIEDFLLDSISDDIPEDWHTIDKNGNREFKKTYLERFPKRVYFTIYGNLLERQDFNNKRIEGIYVPNLLKYDQLQKRSIQDPIKTGMMPSLVFDYTTDKKLEEVMPASVMSKNSQSLLPNRFSSGYEQDIVERVARLYDLDGWIEELREECTEEYKSMTILKGLSNGMKSNELCGKPNWMPSLSFIWSYLCEPSLYP